jgi:photosystem II stability/assembly factor-like uncharacterized protein
MTRPCSYPLAAVFAGLVLSTPPAQAEVNRWTVAGPTSGAVGGDILLAGRSILLAAGGENGLSRSTDFGTTWTPATNGLASDPVIALQEDPAGEALFVATALTIFRSDDGGASWSPTAMLPPGITGLLFDPDDPQILYATFVSCNDFYCDGGATVSTDNATTWIGLAGEPRARLGRMSLSSSVPRRLYILGNGGSAQVWSGPALGPLEPHPFAPFMGLLAVDPLDAFHVFGFGFPTLFVSADGGGGWSPVESVGLPLANRVCAVFDAKTPEVMYLGTRGAGVYRSPDSGRTWFPFNEGLEELTIRSFAISADGKTLYAGTEHGVYQYTFCDACPVRVGSPRPSPRVVSRSASAPN